LIFSVVTVCITVARVCWSHLFCGHYSGSIRHWLAFNLSMSI